MLDEVVVTGMGVVSCVGTGVGAFWESVREGRCGLRELRRLNADDFSYRVGGEAVGFDLEQPDEDDLDPAVRFLLGACEEAVGDGEAALEDRCDCALVISTNFGATANLERFLGNINSGGQPSEGDFTSTLLQSDADAVAARLGAGGPKVCLSLSCASGNAAIAVAADLVRTGRVPAALAAGYDAISAYSWSGLGVLRVMTPDGVVRPFDAGRNGTLFSEGSGALLLESRKHAEERGAAELAIVLGCGMNNNAYHMAHSREDGEGTQLALRAALADAGLGAEQIDHVNFHGTGTKLNDSTETRAVKAVLGRRAGGIPMCSIKGTIGHGMGAASAFEAIASIMTVREGIIPPTVNLLEQDPECDLDYVPGAARQASVRTVLSNSAGIGGCNAAVVFAAPDFR